MFLQGVLATKPLFKANSLELANNVLLKNGKKDAIFILTKYGENVNQNNKSQCRKKEEELDEDYKGVSGME